MLDKLFKDRKVQILNTVIEKIEKDPYAKTEIQKKENINIRKWLTLDLLLDYVLLECDRKDWVDKDVIDLYDYILCKDSNAREKFVMYLVDWNSIEYCNWFRWFKAWEYSKLVKLLEVQDRPLSIMVVCARVYVNEVLKWKKEFTCEEFYTVINWCKWKKLEVY